MARRIELNPETQVLKEIGELARTHMRQEASVSLQPYYFSDTPLSEMRAYIGFLYSTGQGIPGQLTHQPGIPRASLVPEKALPIAQWIVRQIRTQRPDWFIE